MKKAISNTVSAFEAKTHFSQLIQKVQEGNRITILKHNVPVAILSPILRQKNSDIQEMIRNIKSFNKGKKLNGLTIKELINDGRK